MSRVSLFVMCCLTFELSVRATSSYWHRCCGGSVRLWGNFLFHPIRAQPGYDYIWRLINQCLQCSCIFQAHTLRNCLYDGRNTLLPWEDNTISQSTPHRPSENLIHFFVSSYHVLSHGWQLAVEAKRLLLLSILLRLLPLQVL